MNGILPVSCVVIQSLNHKAWPNHESWPRSVSCKRPIHRVVTIETPGLEADQVRFRPLKKTKGPPWWAALQLRHERLCSA